MAILWRSVFRGRRLVVLTAVITCLTVCVIRYSYVFRHPSQYFVQRQMNFIEETPWSLDLGTIGREMGRPGRCPRIPPGLANKPRMPEPVEFESMKLDSDPLPPIALGGHYKPANCLSRTKTAIIVSYRQREQHLEALISHLVPFLVRQQAEFNIFVVEPMPELPFNRALLLNVGFVEAMKTNNFTCIIFHDVDQLPESDWNLYRCGSNPRHLAAASSAYDYQLPYPEYGGAVIGMTPHIYKDVNGHSNLYFGWGGEDDDLLFRLNRKNYSISRYPDQVSRYHALDHKRDKGNDVSDIRYQLLWTTEKRMPFDGINTLKYRMVKQEKLKLYTKFLIDFDMKTYEDAIKEYS